MRYLAVPLALVALTGFAGCGSENDDSERDAALSDVPASVPSKQQLAKLAAESKVKSRAPKKAPKTVPSSEVSVPKNQPEATARATGSTAVTGVVGTGTVRAQRGSRVYLYRRVGSSWTNLGWKGTTDSNGRYMITGLRNGYYYALWAYATFGNCLIVHVPWYSGWSNALWAAGGTRGANIRVYFGGYVC